MSPRPPISKWDIPDLVLDSHPASKSLKAVAVSSERDESLFELEILPNVVTTTANSSTVENESQVRGFDESSLDLGELPQRERSSHTDPNERWPSLLSIRPQEQIVDDSRVSALIPWGEPPNQLFATVAYALSVFRGQRRLTKQIRSQQEVVLASEHLRAKLAIEWFDSHRTQIEADSRYCEALVVLETTEREYLANEDRFQKRRADGTSKRQQLLDQLTRIKAQVERQRNAVIEQNGEYERAVVALQRDQAKRKRLDIERRSGLIDSESYGTQCSCLDEAITHAQIQLASIDTSCTEMKNVERQIALNLRRCEDELSSIERREQAVNVTIEVGLRDVWNAVNNAKVNIVRLIIANRDSTLFERERRDQLLLQEEVLLREVVMLAELLRGMKAFDKRRVRQGLCLILVCLTLFIEPLLARCLF
jgi:hypothetical protein